MVPPLPKAPVRPPPPPARRKTALSSPEIAAPLTVRSPPQLAIHEAVTVKPPAIVEPAAVEELAVAPKATPVEPVPAPSASLYDTPVEHTPIVVFDAQHAAASAGVASCLLKLGEMPLADAWNRRAQALGAR